MKKKLSWILCLIILGLMTGMVDAKNLEYAEAHAELLQEGSITAITPTAETAADETIYDVLYQGMLNCEESIDVSRFNISGATVEEMQAKIKAIYTETVNSHADLYYVTSSFEFFYDSTKVYKVMPNYDSALLESKEQFLEKTDWILSTYLGEDMTDLEKALALHDYLVLNCAYDWNVANGNSSGYSQTVFSIYGALMEENAVCRGYALAYQYLLSRVGIPAGLVISEEMNHAWNWVQIDGKKYHVDVTWDDPVYPSDDGAFLADKPGACGHQYFLLDSETISSDGYSHTGYDEQFHFANTEFLSGYAFNNASSGLIWNDGGFWGIQTDGTPIKITDLHKEVNLQRCPILYHDNAIYYIKYYSLYRLDLITEKTQTLKETTTWLANQGVKWDANTESVWITQQVSGDPTPAMMDSVDMSETLVNRSLCAGTPMCTMDDGIITPASLKDASFVVALTNNRNQAAEIQAWYGFYNASGKLIGLTGAEPVTLKANEKLIWRQDLAALSLPQDTATCKIFWLKPDMLTPQAVQTCIY